jgi:hypothetical protein
MIVTVPDVTAVTNPPEVTVARAERACHVAVADTFCVAPSEKVARAVSWTVWPMLMKSVVDAFTATDDTVADEGAMELDDEPPHDHESTSATRTRIRPGRFISLLIRGIDPGRSTAVAHTVLASAPFSMNH